MRGFRRRPRCALLGVRPERPDREVKAKGLSPSASVPTARRRVTHPQNFRDSVSHNKKRADSPRHEPQLRVDDQLRIDELQLVALLNGIFSRFDLLAERHGVEKIRTIGDNYMCVAGVPRRRADHAQAVARMALGIRAYLDELRAAGEDRIDFRIGMNSGPCVAGVIGLRKLVFDIWGDSVNTASRMESHGVPGRIHLSDATYDEFECEPRGTIEVKGKAPMRTWFLVGERRPHDESARPGVAAARAP